MPTSRDLLASASGRLAIAGVPSPDVDALLLLEHVTGRRRHELRLGCAVDEAQVDEFSALLVQRAERTPLQHLTGLAPFRHLELQVGPGVFIPRPESELIVDEVLGFLDARALASPMIVDLCTGSAALALALATEVPGAQVVGVELSEAAMAWAQRNVEAHRDAITSPGSSLVLHTADATTAAQDGGSLASLRGLVDVVVTNPPYVPLGAIPREPEVRDHDPDLALYGGQDGLEVIRPLAVQAALLLRPGGLLLVEHADVQGEAAGGAGVPALLRSQRDPDDEQPGGPAWRDVCDRPDLAGRPRHTRAIRASGSVLS